MPEPGIAVGDHWLRRLLRPLYASASRLKLLKIGVGVSISVRSVRPSIDAGSPEAVLFGVMLEVVPNLALRTQLPESAVSRTRWGCGLSPSGAARRPARLHVCPEPVPTGDRTGGPTSGNSRRVASEFGGTGRQLSQSPAPAYGALLIGVLDKLALLGMAPWLQGTKMHALRVGPKRCAPGSPANPLELNQLNGSLEVEDCAAESGQ